MLRISSPFADLETCITDVTPRFIRSHSTSPGLPSTGTSLSSASRRQLHAFAERPFTRIETEAPLELVVVDFHHGPFVRVGPHDESRRALLCAFIDRFPHFVPEGRYDLHEDFVALRFGFRRLHAAHGLVCAYPVYVELRIDGASTPRP